MSDPRDPLEVIRSGMSSAQPTPDEEARSWTKVEAAIASEVRLPQRQRSGRRFGLAAASVALAAVLVVVIGLVIRPRADGELVELATAARVSAAPNVPVGSFIYTRSTRVDLRTRPGVEFGLDREYVGYLLPSTRETWWAVEEGLMQLRTVIGPPEFYDSSTREAYYLNGLDRSDQVGLAVVESFADVTDPLSEVEWSITPDILERQLDEAARDGGEGGGSRAGVFDVASDLLRERAPEPAVRAAILEVLAQLDLDLIARDEATLTVGLTIDRPLRTRSTIQLDTRGILVEETLTLLQPDPIAGVPAGTVIASASYTAPMIVGAFVEPVESG